MPWLEATLRVQKVLARVHPDRSFVVDGGRVEIRYRKTDPLAYRARADNLNIAPDAHSFPDDVCIEATFAAPRAEKTPSVVTSVIPPPGSKQWVAYTDGACSGNPGPAGSGMVIVSPDGAMVEGFEYLGVATNNVAELTAIARAVEALPTEAESMIVYTDSQYAIGVLTKGWKAKANQELIAEIRKTLTLKPGVKLGYVPGHRGVPLNERADELARQAVREARTNPLRVT